MSTEELQRLREENATLKSQLAQERMTSKSESRAGAGADTEREEGVTNGDVLLPAVDDDSRTFGKWDLTRAQIERYSRQSILEDFRPEGTSTLLKGRVLIVGAGGLGSSAAMYLATAGVGYLRIVDHDVVERSNLHRQIIHTDARCGMPKCESAKKMLHDLNPLAKIDAIQDSLRVDNAMQLLEGIDVVLDATDNVAARYLINDACVVSGIPLVSGAAIRWEGQLTVYGYRGGVGKDGAQPVRGACYRCMNPRPPPQAAVGSCSDTGVVGAVPGTIGVLQAIEVQKILMQKGDVLSGRMLLFNALQATFRTFKMRGWQKDCAVCGEAPTITKHKTFKTNSCEVGPHNEYSFGACGVQPPPAKALPHTVTCQELQGILLEVGENKKESKGDDAKEGNTPQPLSILLDVRDPVQYELCTLKAPSGSDLPVVNVDGKRLQSEVTAAADGGFQAQMLSSATPVVLGQLAECIQSRRGKRNRKPSGSPSSVTEEESAEEVQPQRVDVYVFCRRGIQSHQNVEALQAFQNKFREESKSSNLILTNEAGKGSNNETSTETPSCSSSSSSSSFFIPANLRSQLEENVTFHNVKGGLHAWHNQVDRGFPFY